MVRKHRTENEVTQRAKDLVEAKTGTRSLAAACRRLDFPFPSLAKILREGLPDNPRVKTVEVVRQLGLEELVQEITKAGKKRSA